MPSSRRRSAIASRPARPASIEDGAIHSIDYPDRARFIRVTGTNLDKINRVRFDLKTGEVHGVAAAGDLTWRCFIVGAGRCAVRLLDSRTGAHRRARGAHLLESHMLFARSVSLSRLELRFAVLVPRKATRIVLVDDQRPDLSERAAKGAGRRLAIPMLRSSMVAIRHGWPQASSCSRA